jgi:hypothetical protein
MDSIPPSTLIFATNLGCVSSLKLLLEASFVLTSTNIGIIVTKAKNGEMDLLIDEIILRRTKIRDLAISCLPEHKWRGIGISRESLPDLIVPKVYETLRAEGVDIPKRLRPLWYSQDLLDLDGELQVGKPCIYFVFHSLYLPVQYMQRLYDAGLTDVDEPDSDGFTPLMCKWGAQSPKELCFWGAQSPAQLFGRARWLVSKGADSSRPLPGTGIPALHTIVNTGILLSHWKIPEILSKASVNKPLANLDRHDLLFLRKAIAENQPDACKCNCSTNGCTPLSLSLKNLGWSIWQKDSNPIVLTISELLHLLPPSSTIMETVIRLMVFEDLDLTHTCCDTDYLPPFDQDETKAIHEEEEQCLSELEQLVDEFMDLYNKLNQPLLQFLQEHWCPRMQEYLQQAQPLSEEELSKTREIGVELSPTCPLRSDAWCVLLQPKITETEELGQSDDSEP